MFSGRILQKFIKNVLQPGTGGSPVLQATQEAEIRGVVFRNQPEANTS
jgi:hypothetical protein